MKLGNPTSNEVSKIVQDHASWPCISEGRENMEYNLWQSIKNDLGILVMDSTPSTRTIIVTFKTKPIWS